MPPNPAPNPLTQLEEARRRLEEEEKRASKVPSKQRYGPQGGQGLPVRLPPTPVPWRCDAVAPLPG